MNVRAEALTIPAHLARPSRTLRLKYGGMEECPSLPINLLHHGNGLLGKFLDSLVIFFFQ